MLLQELLLLLNDECGRGAGGRLPAELLFNQRHLLLQESLLLLDVCLGLLRVQLLQLLQRASASPFSPLLRCAVDDAHRMGLSQAIHPSFMVIALDGAQRVC